MDVELSHIDTLNEELESLRRRIKFLEAREALRGEGEQTLQASEKKYQTIFENTGTGTIIFEEDTVISMVNTEFEILSGYSREEVEGKLTWKDLIAPEDIRRLEGYHKTRRTNPAQTPRTYESRVIIKYGEKRICTLTVALIPGTRQRVASFMDMTYRINAEEALKQSEEKFSKAFRSSPGAICISTLLEGRFIDVNDSFIRMTGHTREEVIGKTANELNIWPDCYYRIELVQKIQQERRLCDHEVSIRVKSGEMRTGVLSAELIDIQDEICMLTAVVDTTEQRRLEKEVLKISEKERQKIGQDLHDDLGQHLVGVEALNTLLEQRLKQENSPEIELAEDISDLIRKATAKTKNLARGLCPVVLDEGGFISALQEFSIHVKKVFGINCTLDVNKDIQIRDNITAINLYHIIQESVNNAIRHGKAKQIIISLTSKNKRVTLSVKDDGTGLKNHPDIQKGLGFNIMKYRAKMIGATIEIKNQMEGGTRVTCRLNQKF